VAEGTRCGGQRSKMWWPKEQDVVAKGSGCGDLEMRVSDVWESYGIS
jgi:hypothetical protein